MMTALLAFLLPPLDFAGDFDIVDTRPSITCGSCRATHRSTFAVRACHAGATIATCDDLTMIDTEDGPTAVPCGWEAAFTDTGFTCAAGHSYTDTATREAQGWDYADDAYDAAVITRGGRDYRAGGPNTFIDPAEVAHVMATL